MNVLSALDLDTHQVDNQCARYTCIIIYLGTCVKTLQVEWAIHVFGNNRHYVSIYRRFGI